MWILLIIAFLIPLVYIGHLMSKVDKFLGKGGLMVEDNVIRSVAIVLGGGDLAQQVIELLQKNGIPVLVLAEPFLVQQEHSFRYLFAMSESDADNIVLCKIGKKVYNLEKIISLCNDQRNEGMFISEKIRYLSGANVTAKLLYEIVLQETEVEV
jgi:hypothetical protein